MRRLLPFRDRQPIEQQVYDLPAQEICDRCGTHLVGEFDFKYFRICPECGQHFGISAARRIAYLVDPDTFEERGAELYSSDPLNFCDSELYTERLTTTRERTDRSDGMIFGSATMGGIPVVLAVLDFSFLGGSMGVVVGERVARAAELAANKKRPLIVSIASGGARMQEGMLSLLQMGKTASAIAELKESGTPYISILSDPTTGGVFASFASLADVILAEPEALIGFAGPRVVEQTLGRALPAGSHSAEFQYTHGMIDAIVARPQQRNYLVSLLHMLKENDPDKPGGAPTRIQSPPLSAWEIVERARATERPSTRFYLQQIMPGYLELHGDREGSDDPAIVIGLGQIRGIPVAFMGFDRFASSEIEGAEGRPLAGGFRKARRLLALAERWELPVVSFIDTPGVYPGIESEASGLASEIARTLERMSSVETPTIAVVLGEGGSGGALALSLADTILIQEGAFFSVIGPEGAATILYRDPKRAPELAESLRITAPDLLELGIIDQIVPEPAGGAAADPVLAAELLADALMPQLESLRKRRISRLAKTRRSRYRSIGTDFIHTRNPAPRKPEQSDPNLVPDLPDIRASS